MADFAIGALSRRAGVNIETIRYYERIGVMPKPPRSDGGRRLYDSASARRLGFIRRARELGFSIEEVRALLRLAEDGGCAEVHALTLRHRDGVRAKIADLKRLDRALTATAAQCEEDERGPCPIIEALETGRPQESSSS